MNSVNTSKMFFMYFVMAVKVNLKMLFYGN